MPFAIPLANRIESLLQKLPAESPFTPDSLVSPHVKTAIEQALDRGETHYTDRPGILPLRERIASALSRRFAIQTNAKSDVIVTCGITEARFVATQQVLKAGEILAAPVSSERLSGAAILRRVELTPNPRVEIRSLYLTSSTPEPILRLHIEAAPPAAFILYEVDEESSKFHPAQLAGCESRSVTLGSLGAESWRVGYLTAPGVVSAGLRDFKQSLTICTTNLSQWAMLAALEAE
jgi:aspartate/methionine/tyrosine aminotransferase